MKTTKTFLLLIIILGTLILKTIYADRGITPIKSHAETQEVITFQNSYTKEFETDVVEINIVITKTAGDFQQAMKQLGDELKKLQETLVGFGISEKDIITTQIQGTPDEWIFGKQTKVAGKGKIRVRDLSKVNVVLQSIQAVGDCCEIENAEFMISNINPVYDSLIKGAAERASVRKLAYESEFGVKLQIQSIQETECGELRGEYYTRSLFKTSSSILASVQGESASKVSKTTKVWRINQDIGYKIIK